MAASPKDYLNLVTIGPHGSGKSTLVGQLMCGFGNVDNATLGAMETVAKSYGNADSKYAFLVDRSANERSRKMTIEPTLISLESETRIYSVLDAPGHPRYVRHLLSSISQADAALLVLSIGSDVDEEEERAQLKEHAVLAYTLGVQKIIICLNKMDNTNYSEQQFNELKNSSIDGVVKIGFREKKTVVIPISAKTGENILHPPNLGSSRMAWYSGPTVFEAMESFRVPKRYDNKSLRMVIHKSFHVTKAGTVVLGRIEFGKIEVNSMVRIQPNDILAQVKSIEFHKESIEEASSGMIVGVGLVDAFGGEVDRSLINHGSVLSLVGDNEARPVTAFTGQVILLAGPENFCRGFEPIICAHGLHIPCTVTELYKTFDKITRNEIAANPESAHPGDGVMCEFIPKTPCVLDEYGKFASLGRFAIRDNSKAIAVGVVKKGTFKKI